MAYIKLFFASLLLVQGFVSVWHYETWWFMQNVNLIFHEAGHIFLMFFGKFFATLGGTIFELGVPLIVTCSFLVRRAWFSVGFSLWWLSTALMSVSVYASDARERALPLITNDPSTHDWFNLLADADMLRYDDTIGSIFYVCAIVSLVLAALCFVYDKDIRALLHRD